MISTNVCFHSTTQKCVIMQLALSDFATDSRRYRVDESGFWAVAVVESSVGSCANAAGFLKKLYLQCFRKAVDLTCFAYKISRVCS